MKAKKSLGQNFLTDKNIISKISASILAKESDLIIEIGPGQGALTRELKKKRAKLLCYEIDTDLKPYLNSLEDNNTKIIYRDILNSNIKEDIENINYDNLYVVGNLPYYITTPIIKYLISLDLNIKEMVFMVQDEVANRWTALPKTKDYGSITLFLNFYFQSTKLFSVSKKCFAPIPKVESAVVKFEQRKDKPNVDQTKYFALINTAFRMKRKTLKNNLSNYDWAKIKQVLAKYDFQETVRAEEISEEIFIELTNVLEE